MMEQRLTRRGLLTGGGLVVVATFACQKREFACTDTPQLPAPDAEARGAIKYVDRAADPTRHCDGCQHWRPADSDSCGGCAVVRGPIHPLGTCQLFAKRA